MITKLNIQNMCLLFISEYFRSTNLIKLSLASTLITFTKNNEFIFIHKFNNKILFKRSKTLAKQREQNLKICS